MRRPPAKAAPTVSRVLLVTQMRAKGAKEWVDVDAHEEGDDSDGPRLAVVAAHRGWMRAPYGESWRVVRRFEFAPLDVQLAILP
jgi:hypothetical protein